ncbi:MAG: hypothetical protein JWM88_3427, partial [Verrucomicrobia bacterium]|nr:hypothetical protein [Lacunisphaera sp.]MDB6170563.1 hypothetical protein [Verrucomicrobiota bacterium]
HTLGRIGGIAGSAARRRHLPFVVSIHGGVMDPPPSAPVDPKNAGRGLEWGRVFGWWWRAHHVLEEADAILTCNTREAELLRERHPHQLIAVQPHGVSTALFRADRRAAARAAFPAIVGRDVLLTVARVDPVKNQLWVVRQLPRIVARHPQVLLVMAGACTNADYGAELQREIQRLGMERHVLLTGGLPPGDPRVVGLMQEARVAILPSITETFGLVILESWAAGLATLASRTSGSLGLVRDGENGSLFSLDNPDEFHAKLERLLQDPAAHTRTVAAGRRGADDYDIAVLAGRVRDLYARLIEEKHALRHSA